MDGAVSRHVSAARSNSATSVGNHFEQVVNNIRTNIRDSFGNIGTALNNMKVCFGGIWNGLENLMGWMETQNKKRKREMEV